MAMNNKGKHARVRARRVYAEMVRACYMCAGRLSLHCTVCMSYLFANRRVMCIVVKKPTRIKLADQHRLKYFLNTMQMNCKTVIWCRDTSLKYSNKIHLKV